MKKAIKIFMCSLLVCILAFCSVTVAFSEEAKEYDEGIYYGYELGTVLVELDGPGLGKYLEGFDHEVEDTRLLTPYSNLYIYSVIFVEKTREVVKEAIDYLSQFSGVISVEKNHYWKPCVMPKDKRLCEFLKAVMAAQREPQENGNFEPGKVMVTMYKGSRSPEGLLENYDVESVELVSDGTEPMDVYVITFMEKTKEIFHKVYPDISACGYVLHVNSIYEGLDEVVKEFGINIQGMEKIISTEPTQLQGDANKDGYVSISDVTTIQSYKANLITEDIIDINLADYNTDGEVTIIDATMLQLSLANLL